MDSHNADSWTSQDSMVRFKLESSTMGSTTFSSVSTSWRNFLFFTLPWSCQDWELCHFLNKHHGSDFGASLEVKSTKPVNLFRRPSFGYSKFEVFLVRSQRFVWVDCSTECLHDLSTSACQSPKTFSRTSNADQHLIRKEQFLSIYLSIIYLTSTSHSSPGNDLFQGRIATKHTQTDWQAPWKRVSVHGRIKHRRPIQKFGSSLSFSSYMADSHLSPKHENMSPLLSRSGREGDHPALIAASRQISRQHWFSNMISEPWSWSNVQVLLIESTFWLQTRSSVLCTICNWHANSVLSVQGTALLDSVCYFKAQSSWKPWYAGAHDKLQSSRAE